MELLFSLLPPLAAIIIAIKTKQVYPALLFGIWLGWVTIHDGNIIDGTFATIQGLVDVFKEDWTTRTIIFSVLVGALILFIQKNGGVEGFVRMISKKLEKYEGEEGRVWVQFYAWLTGVLIFVESSISSLTVGTVYRPLFDKLKIPREKLAYIADSSSAPSSIMMPFNAWGATIMASLALQEIESPVQLLMGSIFYNFYALITLLLVPYFIFSKKDFWTMKKAEERTKNTGKLMNDNAIPMISEELTETPPLPNATPHAANMIIPIAIMVAMMPLMLLYTGWDSALIALPDASTFDKILHALGNGSGSTSVLISVLVSLGYTMITSKIQGIMDLKEIVDTTTNGISALVPLAILILMAFAIGNVCGKDGLDTGNHIANAAKDWLSPALLPAIIFIVSSIIAFSTGTSFGTFAIMIAIAIPTAIDMDANLYLALAAVMGGGVFGDHCSPISDTTIISSMASASDHIDHVKTQMPYALLAASFTVVLYVILGFIL